MKTLRDPENGLVAILDALGAADYSDAEIGRFMRSRENVLGLLTQKAEDVLGDIKAEMITKQINKESPLRNGSSGRRPTRRR